MLVIKRVSQLQFYPFVLCFVMHQFLQIFLLYQLNSCQIGQQGELKVNWKTEKAEAPCSFPMCYSCSSNWLQQRQSSFQNQPHCSPSEVPAQEAITSPHCEETFPEVSALVQWGCSCEFLRYQHRLVNAPSIAICNLTLQVSSSELLSVENSNSFLFSPCCRGGDCCPNLLSQLPPCCLFAF